MKRSNRNFIRNNVFYISKYGQLMPKLEYMNTNAVKFWKFLPESYFNFHLINLGRKPSINSVYSFNWKNISSVNAKFNKEGL